MNSDIEHRFDKLALFLLAGLVVLVMGCIVAGVFLRQSVPDKGDVLLGAIVAGLLAFLRDLVTAVRTSWEGQTWGKLTDQLAGSAPVPVDEPPPKDAVEAADAVADAAADKADTIKGKAP